MADEKSKRPINKLLLNIPWGPHEEAPEPGCPAITLNGVPVHGLVSIAITAGCDKYTTVHLVIQETEIGGILATDLPEAMRGKQANDRHS